MSDVGKIILQQLGGRKFSVMTGASSYASSSDCLSFRLPPRSTRNGVKGVIIRLCGDDTYSVETLKQNPFPSCEVVRVGFTEGVYCEQLCEIFESMTGLRTSL